MEKKPRKLIVITIIFSLVFVWLVISRCRKEDIAQKECNQTFQNVKQTDNFDEALKGLEDIERYLETNNLTEGKTALGKLKDENNLGKFYNTIKENRIKLKNAEKKVNEREEYDALMQTQIDIRECIIPNNIGVYSHINFYRVIFVFSFLFYLLLCIYSHKKFYYLMEALAYVGMIIAWITFGSLI